MANPEIEQQDEQETKYNLERALRILEKQILAAGYIKVEGKPSGWAKGSLNGLEITLSGRMTSNALIALTLWEKDQKTKKIIEIKGWKGTSHIGGPASIDEFVERISLELDLNHTSPQETQASQNSNYWDNWRPQQESMEVTDILTTNFLLDGGIGYYKGLKISINVDTNVIRGVVVTNSGSVVVRFILDAKIGRSRTLPIQEANELKKRVQDAIQRAEITGVTQMA
jgi:hypothetical protein